MAAPASPSRGPAEPARRPDRSLGLAVKITLPFVALFALLLLAMGVVLAREILSEVETQVENRQRFLLEICSFRGFSFEEDMLRDIRAMAADGANRSFSELLVFEDGGRTLSTLPAGDPKSEEIMSGLKAALAHTPWLKSDSSSIERSRLNLAGEDWLVLHTARLSLGAPKRNFFLLYPFARIEQAKNSALERMIALGIAGLLLAAALGLFLAQVISRPVRRLASAAGQISTGGLGETLDPALFPSAGRPGGDEIHHLALAFRGMVESLRRSQQELLKAERLASTGKLAASVAHEIRNPLTSLRMTVEMLAQRGGGDAAAQEAYRIVLNEIDRLALAVEELLTFARPRPPLRQPTDLNQLVRDTLTFMERQMAHARVGAENCLDSDLPKDLPLDSNKIRQLLVNLILNAQQAIVRNGTIRVRTAWDAARRSVLLSVADNGPGIPEAVREKVFELFVSTKAGGGMGLAIARQIVEEHGGEISFATSSNGTTFNISLPAMPTLPEQTAAGSVLAAPTESSAGAAARERPSSAGRDARST